MVSAGYYRPSNLIEAIDLLESYSYIGKLLAGGTDLLVAGRQGKFKEKYLIDLTAISELKEVKEDESFLYIGALLTHTDIMLNPLINKHAKLLVQAVSLIGSPQIRNRGTLGGNIANASPAADSIPALTALESKVTLVSIKGKRVVPLQDLVTGAYRTQINANEIIYNVIVPKASARTKSKFVKIGRRNALAIARISMAGMALQEEDGKVKLIKLVPGAVFSAPRPIEEVEQLFVGRRPTLAMIGEAAEIVGRKVVEIGGQRWSTPYKKPVCENLTKLVLEEILGE